VRWYETSASFLAVGVLAGAAMATGPADWYLRLLTAHVCLNLLGWFGTSIVGTLHTFFPSLVNERLAWPGMERVVYALWTVGVVLLAVGLASLKTLPAACGALALLAASLLLLANLATTAEPSALCRSLPTLLVAAGQLLLPASVALGTVIVIAEGPHALVAADGAWTVRILVIVGWIGFTVGGSLLHLTSLLARVRSRFAYDAPALPPAYALVLVAGALVGVVVLALSDLPGADLPPWAGIALMLPVASVLAVRVAVNLRVVVIGAPERPGSAAA
jgi:nitrite reductase (NO-forming)